VSGWDATYRGTGSITYADSSGSTHYAAPSLFSAGLSADPVRTGSSSYSISGTLGDSDASVGVGFEIRPRSFPVSNFFMTVPRPHNGQISYNFPLAEELPWFDMAVGSEATTLTVDKVFSVTLRRSAPASWRFSFTRQAGYPPLASEATSGDLVLKADSPRPLWKSLDVSAEIKASPDVTYALSFHLALCSTGHNPCPSS
jgi:hypothetical protein